ncbi:DUF397 domain-containing protein [Streptomyces albireticuli]|uniref:DUF397 domain-containing protein n=1 Tax=Streptomyces albireticuli TaxID=1940 RepID=UPI0036BFBDE6
MYATPSTLIAPEGAWIKSSYSGSGNACVEIAELTDHVGIRDSKRKEGPALVLGPQAWTAFIAAVRLGGRLR